MSRLPCGNVETTIPDSGCRNCVTDVKVNGESVVEDGVAEINITPSTGDDKNYTHVQSYASDMWDITHNLGKYPSITVMDSGGTVVQGQYNYIDLNRVILIFSAPFAGTATMN